MRLILGNFSLLFDISFVREEEKSRRPAKSSKHDTFEDILFLNPDEGSKLCYEEMQHLRAVKVPRSAATLTALRE